MRLHYRAVLYHAECGDTQRQQFQTLANDLIQQSSSNVPMVRSETSWRPPIDIYEVHNTYFVQMEIAGMSSNDIDITFYPDAILITGNRQSKAADKENARFHEAQIHYGPFKAAIFFSSAIDGTQVQAVYSDGFLQLNIPQK